MTVWRLCRAMHATRAFRGDGARLHGGRWNQRGTAVVYTSATLSLAVLELLVNVGPDTLPEDLMAISAEIPDSVSIESVDPRTLPRGWRDFPAAEALQEHGSAWVSEGRTAVLAVPSAIVPAERNYLVNPAHPESRRIRIGRAERFTLDPRLPKRARRGDAGRARGTSPGSRAA